MTIGVSFDGRHCKDYYGMWLTNVENSQPEAQTSFVTVPGRNGSLDLSEALTGDVRYKDRTITMTFETNQQICGLSWTDFIELLNNDLHGQRSEITFDGDLWHYSGRCAVSGTPTPGGKYTVKITATCEPYKYDESGNKSL